MNFGSKSNLTIYQNHRLYKFVAATLYDVMPGRETLLASWQGHWCPSCLKF